MYIERMIVRKFRHLKDAEFGSFREPTDLAELIVLAGPNGGGKSSVLELISYGLTNRYSWQYYHSRKITEHSFAIKIGLTREEIEAVSHETEQTEIQEYMNRECGYWMQVNMPDLLDDHIQPINERVHGLVSQRYQNFSRKLGFFIRSDRSYEARNYNNRLLFNWKSRVQPQHFNNISYQSTSKQYEDMYDFLVEQSYHYVYALGMHFKNLENGVPSEKPNDPLTPYNDLLGRLFPGYSFVDASADNLSLRVELPTGDIVPFQDLSSGEKEVFFILSFFIRHNIADSIIIIDEPELHLHPELARKLLQLMRSIRPRNQIWCGTHSAEIVDEAGRERTFFLKTSDDRSEIECIPATQEGAEIQILRDMFGYSGYIGISRNIVFSEGLKSSADRKTFVYLFPELAREIRLIPVGSVNNLYRINRAILALLESDIARCQFYLIRDRDYLSDQSVEKHRTIAPNQLFVLSRYHIENYLLDDLAIADILRSVFHREISEEEVRRDLYQLARANSAAFLRDLVVYRFGELYQSEDCSIGNHSNGLAAFTDDLTINHEVVDPLKTALFTQMAGVNSEVTYRISESNAERIFGECLEEVQTAIDYERDGWKILFPGRYLLKRFSSKHNLGDWPALQNLLIDRLSRGDIAVNPELGNIFQTISSS